MKELTFAEIMKLPEDTLIKVLDHSKFALSGIFCEGKLKKNIIILELKHAVLVLTTMVTNNLLLFK